MSGRPEGDWRAVGDRLPTLSDIAARGAASVDRVEGIIEDLAQWRAALHADDAHEGARVVNQATDLLHVASAHAHWALGMLHLAMAGVGAADRLVTAAQEAAEGDQAGRTHHG